MKCNVYIDGFNVYYGLLKDTPYRWLDVSKLCTLLFPNLDIVSIKYFTAPIKIRADDIDHDKPTRQQIFLRALRTIDKLEVIEGAFLTHPVRMKLADGPGYARVIKSEEKGTDVNIASHLLLDACKGEFEVAVVISNDSDLVAPVRMVRDHFGLQVVVVSPFPKNSLELKNVASYVKTIRPGLLEVSQFNDELKDDKGTFNIPPTWKPSKISEMHLLGVILFDASEQKYLLTKKKSGKFWAFPKETYMVAINRKDVLRERMEKRWCVKSVSYLKDTLSERFWYQLEQDFCDKQVTYFLCYVKDVSEFKPNNTAEFDYKWVTYDEAIRLLEHESAKQLLKKAGREFLSILPE